MKEKYYTEQATQRWLEMCKSASKPMLSMAELNSRTLTNLVKQFEEAGLLKPENFNLENMYNCQMKFANDLNCHTANYLSEMMRIFSASTTEFGDNLNDVMNEIMRQNRASADDISSSQKSNRKV